MKRLAAVAASAVLLVALLGGCIFGNPRTVTFIGYARGPARVQAYFNCAFPCASVSLGQPGAVLIPLDGGGSHAVAAEGLASFTTHGGPFNFGVAYNGPGVYGMWIIGQGPAESVFIDAANV